MTQRTSAYCRCVARWETPGPSRSTIGSGQGGRMKLLTLTGLVVALALPTGAAGQRGAVAGCDPLGNVRFICNQVAPEDLALVPGGEWLISSGMAANGAIRLINIRDKTTTAIFPSTTPK